MFWKLPNRHMQRRYAISHLEVKNNEGLMNKHEGQRMEQCHLDGKEKNMPNKVIGNDVEGSTGLCLETDVYTIYTDTTLYHAMENFLISLKILRIYHS